MKVGDPGKVTLNDTSGWKDVQAANFKNKHEETAPLRPVAVYERSATLKKVNLKAGQEILIRWTFVKKENTGISAGIDNVCVKNFK